MIVAKQNKTLLRLLFITLAIFTLASCGKSKVKRVEGERFSVLSLENQLVADADINNLVISLPRSYVNKNWAQAGGSRNKAMYHLALPQSVKEVWRIKIGKGDASYERLVSTPIVYNEVIFTIDIKATVSAFATSNGRLLWQTKLKDKDEYSKVAFGGGVSTDGKYIYATTGFGFAVALDIANGNEIWRQDLVTPLRSSPSVSDGRLFVTSQDNRVVALNTEDGSIIWDYVGIVENAAILGAASPAIQGDTVVVALSSGEIFAMRAQNGQIAWQDALSRSGRMSAISTLNDIDGNPVIDRGRVYAVNHSGRMVSIDLRTGERVWETNISGLYTPWIAGNFIYMVSAENELVALSLRDGRVRWVTPLQRFKDPDKRKGLIRWSGPVLAGDRLLIVSSDGYVLSVSPYTGDIISGEKLPDGSVLPPIVANQTVYILTKNGELIAYR